MKTILVITAILINLSANAEMNKTKKIEVRSVKIENIFEKPTNITKAVNLEPASIFQTTAIIDDQGKLKHMCNKTHKHPVQTNSEKR